MALYSRKASIGFASLLMLMVAPSWAQDVPPVDGVAAEEMPAAPLTTGRTVYKSVDSKGMVTFTDTAPIGRPSEAIVVQAANTMPTGVSRGDGATVTKEKIVPVKYAVTITSPANEEFFGQEAEAVMINVELVPDLREGDTFQLYYDGKPVADGARSYTVTEMYRGTHTVEAKVFDKDKKLLSAADKVQFYIRRISKLMPDKPDGTPKTEETTVPTGSLSGSDPGAAGMKSAGGASGPNGSSGTKGANGSLGAGGLGSKPKK